MIAQSCSEQILDDFFLIRGMLARTQNDETANEIVLKIIAGFFTIPFRQLKSYNTNIVCSGG